MNSLVFKRVIDEFVDVKIKSGFESKTPQYSERIIFEGDQGSERGSDYFLLNVRKAFFSPIFYFLSIDVVEQGIDSEISSEGVSERSSHLNLRNS